MFCFKIEQLSNALFKKIFLVFYISQLTIISNFLFSFHKKEVLKLVICPFLCLRCTIYYIATIFQLEL